MMLINVKLYIQRLIDVTQTAATVEPNLEKVLTKKEELTSSKKRDDLYDTDSSSIRADSRLIPIYSDIDENIHILNVFSQNVLFTFDH